MIRNVMPEDAPQIAAIYNYYVANSTVTFETETLTPDQMLARIQEISAEYPYFVWEEDGRIIGFSYAHQWKEREAYRHTWEATVYLHPDCRGRGIGRKLETHLIEECRQRGCRALIACLTAGNVPSEKLQEELGFRKVSYFPEVGQKLGQILDVEDYELLL